MDQVALITGAGSGIGLELCRALLTDGYTVVACPHSAGSPGLASLSETAGENLHVVPLDVTDEDSITSAVREVSSKVERIDLLFNNGAVYPSKADGLNALDPSSLLHAFDVNTIGPLRVIKACLPLLRRGRAKRLIQITSLMGSIADNSSGGSYAYRLSKCALNMAVRNLAHELGSEGFIALAIHPGWVKTKMGGAAAPLDLEPAVQDILRTALGSGAAENGSFKGPGGASLPY